LIHALAKAGITQAFGIPGVHNLELYRGLDGSGIDHVTSRHEQGAAFMADGYGRMQGRPALVLPITGPGLLNAATAIGQAYSDSVPMIVVATNNPTSTLGLGGGELHETRDQTMVMQGILDAVYVIRHPDQVMPVLRQAIGQLRSARPRPVYIELPIDIASMPAPADADLDGLSLEPARPVVAPDQVERLADLLRAATRPAFLLGGGARHAQAAIRDVAAKTGALVVCSVAGKGIVPDDANNAAGALLGHEAIQQRLAEADCILAVGTELAMTDRWVDLPRFQGKIVRIDIDAAQLARMVPPHLAIQASAESVFSALQAKLHEVNRPAWYGDLAAIRREAAAAWGQRLPRAAAILEALRAALPDDGIVVSDMTQIAYGGNSHFPVRQAGTWLHPVGYGTLGYGMPAAIGAKLAAPQRAVVSLSGDYGFGFTSNELAVASSLKLSLPVIVWNNQRLGQIQDDMDRLGIPRLGVEIEPPSLELVARAHGAAYVAPADLESFKTALTTALSAPQPIVIEMTEKA
jgi:thiamine pyrophosphate-dependent acetolactate synthase large subunit-like protein